MLIEEGYVLEIFSVVQIFLYGSGGKNDSSMSWPGETVAINLGLDYIPRVKSADCIIALSSDIVLDSDFWVASTLIVIIM